VAQVKEFLKTTARYLGYSESPVEKLFAADEEEYSNDEYEKDYIEDDLINQL